MEARADSDALRVFEGVWHFESRVRTVGGEAVGHGLRVARLDYGGHWLVQEDEFAEGFGKGLETIGYDPGRRAYVLMSLSSRGAGLRLAYGGAEADGRVLRFQGEWTEPGALTSARGQIVYEVQAPGKISMRWQRGDGTESGEIVYTRRQDPDSLFA